MNERIRSDFSLVLKKRFSFSAGVPCELFVDQNLEEIVTDEMVDMEVHECDLFEHEPFEVQCFALDERQGVLAVARYSDIEENCKGVIEFWNVIGTSLFHIRTTPLGKKTAESLCWIDDILLATHLDGSITGHRVHTSKYFTVRLTPSPLWCLTAISKSELCASSNSGAVLLFSWDGCRILLNKTIYIGFDVHIISLACNGEIIAAGTTDEISLINVFKTRVEHTLRLPRVEKRKPTIVWCLSFIGNLLVSGDSRGYITFWDASKGAFSHCLQTHQADVLSIAVTGETLYAAGVDPTIARLALNQERTAYRVEHRRTIHSNDVRALIASKHTTALYSGGADYYFCVSDRLKHMNGLKQIACSVATAADIFSYQYSDRIVIWRIGKTDERTSRKGICFLKNGPIKVAQLRSHCGEFIISSALSRDGSLIGISTACRTTLYKLNFNFSSEVSISVLRRLEICAAQLLFTSTSLFIASESFRIFNFPITSSTTEYPETIAERDNAGEVMRLHANTIETSLVLLTTRNEIFILDIKRKVLRKLENTGSNVFIDAQFINATSLYILCADLRQTVIEYNTKSNILSGSIISTESLCMSPSEVAMEMDCSDSNGIILVGSRGSFRIITLVGGKRVLLCGPEACALMKEGNGEEARVCLIRRDRYSHGCWLASRKLLLTTPVMLAEPSQTAFRLKRYGQN